MEIGMGILAIRQFLPKKNKNTAAHILPIFCI